MEEVMKSLQHKRDGQGNVVLDWVEEREFDYVQENNLFISIHKQWYIEE
jgi:hypothetical protein